MRKKTKKQKINRKKGHNEPEIDEEYQKQINELATQFKEDQLKSVLRRCYKNVQKYGPEAILKALDNSFGSDQNACSIDADAFVEIEAEITSEHMEENLQIIDLEVNSHWANSTKHDHAKTSKRNALFLIESSERLDDYDSDTLMEMKRAYERGNYDDVADLAYLQDRSRRPVAQSSDDADDSTPVDVPSLYSKNHSPWFRVAELLEEVAEDQKETPLKYCVEAVRHLSGDLTYDDRTAAKDSIRKAIACIECDNV